MMRISSIIFLIATVFQANFTFAANPVSPPIVSICDFLVNWLGKFIEVEGVLTHFEVAVNAPLGTPNLQLTSSDCASSKPILTNLSFCGRCECWETQSHEIWNVITALRSSKIKSAKIKTRGELEKSLDKRFRYTFKVNCIQRIIAQ
jgi:hypothetical protein